MSDLKEGDTVWLASLNQGIREARYWSDADSQTIWVAYPEDWERLKESNDYLFCRGQNQYRATRSEALQLLLQKLSKRRKELMREASEVTDKIADVINEMYPE
jgi:hypothetical protein